MKRYDHVTKCCLKFQLVFILIIYTFQAIGQSSPETSFFQYKQFVDSLTMSTDSDSLISFGKLVGNSKALGAFNERYYYHRTTKELKKIVYNFESDTSWNNKKCYYYRGELIKFIMEDGAFYCREEKLYDEKGILIDKNARLSALRDFEKEFRGLPALYIPGIFKSNKQ